MKAIHLTMVMLVPTHVLAEGGPTSAHSEALIAQPVFKDGANCLFIGHSFFIPVARSFGKIATQNDFPSHQAEVVFSPGLGGAPRGLWDNERRRRQVDRKLAGGTVELFGMPVAGRSPSAMRDYQRWIDLALEYNPKTRILIGQYWIPGGPKMDVQRYVKANEAAAQRNFEVVSKLRRAYPNNHIYFVDYGEIASQMKSQFQADGLTDIKQLVGRDETSLFRDGFMGHGGALMHRLSALTWLVILYGAEIERLQDMPLSVEAIEIAVMAIEHNEQFK